MKPSTCACPSADRTPGHRTPAWLATRLCILVLASARAEEDSTAPNATAVPDCTQRPDAPAYPPYCTRQSCERCFCLSDERCREGLGCVGTAEIGDSCSFDAECASDNSGELNAVCRVPVGEPCTAQNCDPCLQHTSGWSCRSRVCSSERDCGGGQFGDCEYQALECTVADPKLSLGEPCRANEKCEDDRCYRDGFYAGTWGYFSSRCLGSEGCGEGYRCAGIFCDDNGVTGCNDYRCRPVHEDSSDCTRGPDPHGFRIGSCARRRPVNGAPDVNVCDVQTYPVD